MLKTSVGAVVTALLLIAGDVYGQATVTNFDSVPDGTSLASHNGMTFTCIGICPDGGVFARVTAGAPSSPNTVTLVKSAPAIGVHNPTTGVIGVTLACPANKVSVKAKSTSNPVWLGPKQFAQLTAFGRGGNKGLAR
jgi:hypothetical protein